jgi:hypothetical protein
VFPLNICGVVLGSIYLYDRNVIFHRKKNTYHIFKDGIEYIVKSHKMKTNLALENTRQMKTLINSSKMFVLMVIKTWDKNSSDAFKGCDLKLKNGLIEIVNSFDKLFKEPKRLFPKR